MRRAQARPSATSSGVDVSRLVASRVRLREARIGAMFAATSSGMKSIRASVAACSESLIDESFVLGPTAASSAGAAATSRGA